MMNHQRAAQAMTADCLCFRARRVSRAITRMYDDALRPLSIQATQLTLLNAVAMHGERGATMARLAEILAMDATTLSRALKPLETAGLLQMLRLETDRRVRLALLTEAGGRCVDSALPLWTQAHARVVAALGDEAALDLRDRFDHVSAAAARAVSAAAP
ncbi:MarR family winged helix-turn-helix transcriptional regulator [Longimicrobium terrae]|uniref:DNA-binding MarR family transcriptional regulator n=1 Tax=Longimicrobium terrae TaxID=1639882 RepID=A0A841H0C5_9BACT|nr:MarR family winged helix-turn-helix transcriptional regulator [Longimicrobium terrae]MBB4636922.1 DNA-binding MarR family transcriptional regulator [Longimicrobium terrae]MBB6071470.1 DNA-binding MarR family transcriptional regulator [Longimicrobium terrae]NNC31313.1 winged helix-turn-helix transcriptional regulator [Longimicrobium terrae]